MGIFDDAPDDFKPLKSPYDNYTHIFYSGCECPQCRSKRDLQEPSYNDGTQPVSYQSFPDGVVPSGPAVVIKEGKDKIAYKYNEDQSIDEIKRYIDSTYSAHYKSEDNLQAIDAWFSLGDADSSFRDTIIKYAWRLGKKEGHQKDLMKIIHYAIFYLEFCRRKGLK
jgi:hypothetical protein